MPTGRRVLACLQPGYLVCWNCCREAVEASEVAKQGLYKCAYDADDDDGELFSYSYTVEFSVLICPLRALYAVVFC